MYSVYDDRSFHRPDCSIRISTDQCLLTTPRSFSQLVTSFFGSRCQGLERRPKKSFYWYKKVIASNGEDLSNDGQESEV